MAIIIRPVGFLRSNQRSNEASMSISAGSVFVRHSAVRNVAALWDRRIHAIRGHRGNTVAPAPYRSISLMAMITLAGILQDRFSIMDA
jgi:hypothetical protein